jgi:predicted permease
MWRRRRALDDLDDDIRDHLERETAENIGRGLTPDAAREAARRAFGSVARAKEDTRAVWVPTWIDHALQDARYALRLWCRAPAFSLVLAGTLALGIGLTTAVFSVVNAVLIRPLAYRDGHRLVWIVTYDDRFPIKSIEVVSAPDFLAFRERASTLDRVVAFFIGMERVTARGEVVAARVATVSYDFWDLAGANAALGRLPTVDEDAVMLSEAFFERAFGGDASVVGRVAIVNDRPVMIAGVLPRGFAPQLPPPTAVSQLSAGEVEAYHTTIIRPPAPTDLGVRVFNVIARMRPNATVAQVSAELEAIRADVRRANPGPPGRLGAPRLRVEPFSRKLVGDARRPLLILLGSVVLLLATACANTANLLLARASARRKEVAIRAAIGAGRARVLRQFIVESALLSAVGGVGGLLIARAVLAAMVRLLPDAVPRLLEASIDRPVLAFAAAVSTATAIVCGVAPAAGLWRMNVQDVLKDGARTRTGPVGALRLRRALVAIEVALAAVLLVSTVLLVESLWHITAYPPGFAPHQVLTMKVQFSGPAYRAPERRRAYVDMALERARAVPGVVAAGVSANGDTRIRFVRQDLPGSMLDRPIVLMNITSAGYAAVVGMRVVQGRWMTDDEPSAVFVINEALARRYFAGENPIGRRLLLPHGPDPAQATPISIVGVVADLKDSNLETATEPELFTDYRHSDPFGITLAARTAADPVVSAPAIRAGVAAIDRTQPVFGVKRLDAALAESIAPRRFTLALLGTFATSAVLLAMVGIYGVIAYVVAQRTQEIGVRMALGAERHQVVTMIVRQGMTMAMAGLALGAAAAAAATRVLATLLYQVRPTDAAAFAAGLAAIATTALVACSGPAIKASMVDPVVALRCD